MLSDQLNEKLVKDIFTEFPEFKEYIDNNSFEEFRSSCYLIFGPFGLFLTDMILNDSSSTLVDKSFNYINNLSKIEDVEEMLKVTFLEILTDYRIVTEISRNKLKGRALELFEEVLNGPIFDGGRYAK